jgi:UTP--glucose-1-phosphate uridylyltransferase
MKAIIPVAGLGTRMLPATKAIPKELLPVYDRPIIQHVVEEAIAAGITEIILVTRSGKEAIENHFDAHYELEHRLEKKGKEVILKQIKHIIPPEVQVISVRQEDALGLGHAILCAKRLVSQDEPFAVLLPDVLLLDAADKPPHHSFTQSVKRTRDTGIGQVMVERVQDTDVDQYGIVDLNGAQLNTGDSAAIKAMVEKPQLEEAPSNLAVLGRYVLPYRVMELLEHVQPGAGGEIQLTDALDELLKEQPLEAFLTDAEVHDCGNQCGFVRANVAVARRAGMEI